MWTDPLTRERGRHILWGQGPTDKRRGRIPANEYRRIDPRAGHTNTTRLPLAGLPTFTDSFIATNLTAWDAVLFETLPVAWMAKCSDVWVEVLQGSSLRIHIGTQRADAMQMASAWSRALLEKLTVA
jgi:hypothetical protein